MTKICEVRDEMVEHNILSKTIDAEVLALKSRWAHLEDEAKQRQHQLEIAMSEAQFSEKRINNMQSWITRMEVTFNNKPVEEITSDELGYDVKQFAAEFKSNERLLDVFEQEVDTHRVKGRFEAADRLNEQLDMLKLRFAECQAKFHAFISSNSFFENRLGRALVELRQIEKSAHVLRNIASSPVELHEQYQHCVKLYRSLSEVKAEIETVIKTGRKICEINVTKNKKTMSNSIDVLKLLFNTLGENVTRAKKSLEESLSGVKLLQDNIAEIERLFALGAKENDANDTATDDDGEPKRCADIIAIVQQCKAIFEQHMLLSEIRYPENMREKVNVLEANFYHGTSADRIGKLLETVDAVERVTSAELTEEECR